MISSKAINRISDNSVWISLVFCAIFWVMDSLVHATIFPRGGFWKLMFQPDSELIWMRTMVIFLTIMIGYIIQLIIVSRKRAEEEAEKAHKFLQLILDTIPIRVFWKDAKGTYLGCNRLFAKDSGMESPREVIGKNDFNMGWKEQAELYRADDLNVFKSGVPKIGYEEPQTTPDGSRIWLKTSKIPLTDHAGRIFGVLGMYEEITSRKKADQELRERESLLRSTLEAFDVGILIVDDNGKLKASNSSFAEMWHIPREMIDEGNDDRMLEFVLEQLVDPESFLTQVRKLYGTHHYSRDNLNFKDGRVFDRITLPLTQDGKILGRIWIFRDNMAEQDFPIDHEKITAFQNSDTNH